jgi:hypothetical protein
MWAGGLQYISTLIPRFIFPWFPPEFPTSKVPNPWAPRRPPGHVHWEWPWRFIWRKFFIPGCVWKWWPPKWFHRNHLYMISQWVWGYTIFRTNPYVSCVVWKLGHTNHCGIHYWLPNPWFLLGIPSGKLTCLVLSVKPCAARRGGGSNSIHMHTTCRLKT